MRSKAINDFGAMVGTATSSDEQKLSAFLLFDGKVFFFMFPGARVSAAHDINNQFQIVGEYHNSSGLHGFIVHSGGFRTIDFPGAEFTVAEGINDVGEIVGDFSPKEYGNEWVAITSRYRLLKSAINAMSDRASVGLVRYGAQHLIGKRANIFRYITTKRSKYAHEQEVRAFLWIPDPHAAINRHYDEDNRVHSLPLTPPPAYVLKGQRRKVDLQALVTEIVVSPWASSTTLDEVKQLVRERGLRIPIRQSELARYAALLP